MSRTTTTTTTRTVVETTARLLLQTEQIQAIVHNHFRSLLRPDCPDAVHIDLEWAWEQSPMMSLEITHEAAEGDPSADPAYWDHVLSGYFSSV